jgi:probable rRNA maturation factor
VLEIEVLGAEALGERAPAPERMRRLCVLAAATAGVEDGHLAIEFVDSERIAALNAEHRNKPGPTDVLSFPIDGADPAAQGVRELGDVAICAQHTRDLCEAVVHGVLHLLGMDHELDRGEMLAVQAELLRWEALPASAVAGDAPVMTAPTSRDVECRTAVADEPAGVAPDATTGVAPPAAP